MLFPGLPVIERPAAAAAAGFEVVETWWVDTADHRSWARAVTDHGLGVALINSNCGDIAAGQRGFLNVPEMYGLVLKDFRNALRLATCVGARCINVLVGIAIPGIPRPRQLEAVVHALSMCASEAARADVTIVVEPLNEHDVPGYLLPNANAAVELIERVDSSAVRLLYDVYHAARAGSNIHDELRSYCELISHLQVADSPGRGLPGTGSLNIQGFIQTLAENGYLGAVGLECKVPADGSDPIHLLRRMRLASQKSNRSDSLHGGAQTG